MFARVNSPMVVQRVPSVLKALQYSQWAMAVAAEAVGLVDTPTARVAGGPWGGGGGGGGRGWRAEGGAGGRGWGEGMAGRGGGRGVGHGRRGGVRWGELVAGIYIWVASLSGMACRLSQWQWGLQSTLSSRLLAVCNETTLNGGYCAENDVHQLRAVIQRVTLNVQPPYLATI